MRRFFKFEERGTNYSREILGGLTTFITMAYIIVVNPAILENAGIPKGPSMVATILSAVFGTLIMGLYANRPFAIAPYMGENAFLAFTVVKVLGYPWQTAVGAVFISGVLFTLLTVFKVRSWLVNTIPLNLKYSFGIGIGLFLAFIGMNEMGLVVPGTGTPVQMGDVTSAPVLFGVLSLILMAVFIIYRVRGGILIAILFTTIISGIFNVSSFPQQIVSLPPSLSPIFLKLDIAGALTWGFFSVILTMFMMDFLDTMGTLIGVSVRANLLDKDGNLPEVEKPMLVDSLSTIVGALLGTSTAGVYIESAAGVEVGARTGFSSIVVSLLFLISLFFAPVFTSIPAHAYGPALVIVGVLMFSPIIKMNFEDYTEFIPSFAVIVLMAFTYNIGIGMTAGFVLYPLLKILSGRWSEITTGTWILGGLSLLFFIFYPHA
ncbi:NCS2 family permease [candidate division KSB1 bacterium]|nr:NCS2 family permease [candidate division KSB1 bacterium]